MKQLRQKEFFIFLISIAHAVIGYSQNGIIQKGDHISINESNDDFEKSGEFTTHNFSQNSILPINLVAFNVSRSPQGARLKWIAKDEFQAIRYTLQKSTDGVHFNDVFYRDGLYKESDRNSYEYNDAEIIDGTIWYRLKLISATATTSYSKTILINTGHVDFNVITLDNPFTRKIRTEINVSVKSDVSISVSDEQGKHIYNRNATAAKGSTLYTIDNLDHLSPGIYYLKVGKGTDFKIVRLIKY